MNKWPLTLISLVTALPAIAQNCEDNTNVTPIAVIQGKAMQSQRLDEKVTTMGIVTHNWANEQQLGGIFIQSPDHLVDDDVLTSEGIFVQSNSETMEQLVAGTLLKLTGTVAETNRLTQLTEVSEIFECGRPESPVAPIELTLPFDSLQQAEAAEGMLVTLNGREPLTISGHYPLARYGYFDVSAGRLWTPTQIAQPGSEAAAVASSNALNRVQIDDNSNMQPAELPHQQLFHGPQHSLRSGAQLAPVTGLLTQYGDDYRLQPTSPPQLAQRSLITPIHPKRTNELRISSFNVLNYFNGDGQGDGFPTERGAKTPEQLQRQQNKIVAAITALNADVVGLMEVENDGFEAHSAIRELVAAINQQSDIQYTIAQPQSTHVGSDQISVALIYNQQRLRAEQHAMTLAQGPFRRGSRVPLAQVFSDRNSGEQLTVVVNHFKSKGSCPDNGVNANQNDGQACWNPLRLESAQVLTEWLATQQLPQPVLLGDFNAYFQEQPIQFLINNGYPNVSSSEDYSYVYDSQAGALDHIFVHSDLMPKVTRVQHINFNADEPISYDYRDKRYYEPGPYRSSDHDPLLIDVKLSSED